MEIDYADHPGVRRAALELELGFNEIERLSAVLKIHHGLPKLLSSTGTVLFFIAILWVLPAGNWQEILVFNYDYYRILACIYLIYFSHEWLVMDLSNWHLRYQEWSFRSLLKWSAFGSFGQERALHKLYSET